MKNLNLILVTVILMFRVVTFGQSWVNPPLEQAQIKHICDTSSIMIEGVVIDTKTYSQATSDSGGDSYIYYIVKPTKIFKGMIDSTKVYEVFIGKTPYSNKPLGYEIACALGSRPMPKFGIFFFSSESKIPDFIKSYDNSIGVNWYYAIDYNNYDQENTLKFFNEKLGLKPIAIFYTPVKPIEDGSIPLRGKKKINTIPSGQNSLNNKTGHSKSIQNLNEVSFAFANEIVTGTGPYHLEFDVQISASDPGTWFDNCVLDLAYNIAAFGDSVFNNNNVVVSPILNYALPQYGYVWNVSDLTPNVIGVVFGSNNLATSWDRIEVTSAFTGMLHFNFTMSSCSQPVDINFTFTANTLHGSLYTTQEHANFATAIQYDSTEYLDSVLGTFCQPQINYFTEIVYPGTYYPLNGVDSAYMKITGEHFGGVQDSGNVYFQNANNGYYSNLYPLNQGDIISWNDNVIELNLPTNIDSFPRSVGPAQWTHPCPGSGIFAIITNAHDTIYSFNSNLTDTTVLCPYALDEEIRPAPNTWAKQRTDLGKTSADSFAYVIHLDSSIINYNNNVDPMIIPCIVKAAAWWKCNTGINWRVDTTNSSLFVGGFNNGQYCDIFLNQSFPMLIDPYNITLMATASIPSYCPNTNNDTVPWQSAFKIGIRTNPSSSPSFAGFGYWFDTTYTHSVPIGKIDFYAAILHELGHAELLKHVMDSLDLMYCEPRVKGPINYQNRVDIGIENQNGGWSVNLKSEGPFTNSLCWNIYGPYIQSYNNCNGAIGGIQNINHSFFDLKMYPNPLNEDLLNIAYTLKQNSPVTFEVLDITGREVYSMNENNTAGQHTDQLNLDNLSIGIYLIKIIIGDTQDTQKLVKIR